MPTVIIIGNSAAGFSACRALLKKNGVCDIAVISQEAYPAYRSDLLLDYLAGVVSEKDLFLCGSDFYEKNNVRFLQETTAARVDPKKRRVILKDGAKLEYDYLIIASGQRIELPDIPGKTKDGALPFYSLGDALRIKDKLMVGQTVCIVGGVCESQKLGEIISAKGKEVKVISCELGNSSSPHEKVEILYGVVPSELIGEGAELQALKLSNGKVIGTSMVVFLAGRCAASAFTKDTDIETNQGYIVVDAAGRTTCDNVFACGTVCCMRGEGFGDKTWDQAVNEGAQAADAVAACM